MVEHAAVAVVSLTVWCATGCKWMELIGCMAVQCGFGHAAITDRLAEREALRASPEVECHRWSLRYFVGKEALWFAYFAAHRSWSALVGVAVFLAYPAWRRWYRARRPIGHP
jgi:hypothetical protein